MDHSIPIVWKATRLRMSKAMSIWCFRLYDKENATHLSSDSYHAIYQSKVMSFPPPDVSSGPCQDDLAFFELCPLAYRDVKIYKAPQRCAILPITVGAQSWAIQL